MDATKITIPGYQIKHQIGSGGMSVVYLAEQLSLHREVALKVMRPVVTDESHSIQRFEHEARTIAQLYHPNIMSIYDVGHLDDGTLFYAMPYLTHGDLSVVLWRDDEHIKSVFMAICDGLALAHEHGVIHRDMKPENILFDSFDHPQIADFGIAISDQHKRWTKDNSIVGSLSYMSPEQAQSQAVDARSDIYALGAMLYEVVTGSPVFKEKEELALMMAHVSKVPDTLPHNKGHWQAVISGCLAKQSKQRFQTAHELKAAINAVNCDHIATQSRPKIDHNYGKIGIAAVVALFFIFWLWPNNDDQPSQTETTNNTQFISTGNTAEVPAKESHYIELTQVDQNHALPQLIDRLEAGWQIDVASGLLEPLFFHLETQPEHSLTVAKTYIDKIRNSSLNDLKDSNFSQTLKWQQLLNKTQTTFKVLAQPELSNHILTSQDDIASALNEKYLTHKSIEPDMQQNMLALWPDLNTIKETTASNEPQPQHPNDLPTVVLSHHPKLALTTTEVTVGQFRPFANATAMESVRCKNLTTSSLRFSSKTWSNPGFPQKNNHPVVCITWQQATDFAHWLSNQTGHTYRLPKANEWMMGKSTTAAKCGQHNVAGQETEHLKIKYDRHTCQDRHVQTAPVKSYSAANPIFGMQGNVREWLQGCKKKNKIQSFFSNSNECDSHPTIGQSWLSDQQDAGDVNYDKSGQAWAHIGFRLVREL